jgi:hypothetical protein
MIKKLRSLCAKILARRAQAPEVNATENRARRSVRCRVEVMIERVSVSVTRTRLPPMSQGSELRSKTIKIQKEMQ